jgi:hypothetical protein
VSVRPSYIFRYPRVVPLRPRLSGATDAIANRVKAGAGASKTVHEVIDLSTAPPEVQKRYYKRLDLNQVVLRRDLSRYRNYLTKDSSGSMNEWNSVEFP